MIRVSLVVVGCHLLAACGGSAAGREWKHQRTVRTADGTEILVQVTPDAATWNPVCRVRYPYTGTTTSYPIDVSLVDEASRATVEKRFRVATKVPWTTVEVSRFGTVQKAALKSGGEFGVVSHEGLPRYGYDSDRMRRYWQTKVESSLSFLGSPPARDLRPCPDDTSFVVLIGQDHLWLHQYGVRWYSYPAWSEETGAGNLGDYADQTGVEVYGSPVPYFTPPQSKSQDELSALLDPFEVTATIGIDEPPGRHACDCEDGPSGCDACHAYARQAAEEERAYEEARQKVESYLGEHELVIRDFVWRKQWAAIAEPGATRAHLRLVAHAPQVDVTKILPEDIQAYAGMVRADYTLNDSQQHRLHTTMLDAVTGDALADVECRGVFEGTSILNCLEAEQESKSE